MQPDVQRLAAELGSVPARTIPHVVKAVATTLGDIKTDARADAPVHSGRYKRSISYDHDGLTGEVGPKSPYGHLVEDGGARSAPNPVMARATEKNVDKFEERIAKAVTMGTW